MENKSILNIESLAANAWQPEEKSSFDGWVLRYSRGITRRGNSVLPIKDDGGISTDEKFDLVEDYYSEKQQPAIFQLTNAAQPKGLYQSLKKRGYTDNYFTEVQIASPEQVLAQSSNKPLFTATLHSQLDSSWFEVYTSGSKMTTKSIEVREGILQRIPNKTGFLQLKDGTDIVGIGLGVIENSHLGIYCMVTPKKHRRKGVAYEAVQRLTKWGQANKVKQIYLQVMENNLPALALYAKAGFLKKYHYWYAEKEKS